MTSRAEKQSWPEFASAVAAVVEVPPSAIQPTSRLVADLGVDSLALTELVVLLIIDFEMATIEREVATRDWEQVTCGELFDEYQRDQAPAAREQFVIRTQRPR